MKIFIDSNQFISDFLLKGAPFRYLFHFLSNSGHTLLLSRLVIEEVENKYAAEAQKAQADFLKNHQRLNQLGMDAGVIACHISSPMAFKLEELLRSHLNFIEIVEYAEVPHAEVVQRALTRRKPFDSVGDVGYRDCLLWLSLIQNLTSRASEDDEEVGFISSNWRDFYKPSTEKQSKAAVSGKAKLGGQPGQLEPTSSTPSNDPAVPTGNTGVQFHSDLAHDLKALQQKVLPFDSVAAFVDSTIDKREHVINYEKKFELFEEFIEESGLNLLKRLEGRNAAVVLQWVFSQPTASALTILRSDAETFEGIEDFDIYIAEEVGQNIYVSCGYDLRIVNVTLIVPRIQYEAHRYDIEAASHVWDTTILEDETVEIHLSLRCYFQASFSFDPKAESCEGFSLQTFSVR